MTGVAVGGRLYERTEETAAIDATLTRLAEGRGGSLLLEGRAGRGKSALLEYAAQRGRESGARTLGVRARHLSSSAPYEVLRRLLGPAVEQAGGPEALTGAARFASPLFTPGGDVTQGVDYGCQWLVAWLAEQSPLVLVVDDAHWADEASVRVLLDLQSEIAVQPVAMFVASRPVENPEVQRLLAGLAVHPDCDVLIPGALSRDAVAQMVTDRLGRPADDAFVGECLKASGGNAFYLGELLRPLESDPDAEQRLTDHGSLSLRRMVAMRLGELGEVATALAQAAAVLGDGCALPVVTELAEVDPAQAVHEVARLEVASILAHGDPVEFQHPLVRAAIEAELPDVVSGQLHARAARLIREAGADPGAVAQHLVASPGSGDPDVAEFLLEQGRVALEAGSVAVAVRVLRRALDEPAPSGMHDRILLWLGRAEHRAQDLEAAREHLASASDSADRDVAVRAATDLFDVLAEDGRFEERSRLHERAVALRPYGPSEGEVLLRAALLFNVAIGVDEQSAALPEELAGIDSSALSVERDVDRFFLVSAAVVERTRNRGTTEGLMANLRRAVAALPRSADEFTDWDVRAGLEAATYLGDDDLDESEAVLDRVAPAAARLAGVRPDLQAELGHRRMVHALSRGRFEDLLTMLGQAEDYTERHGLTAYRGLHRWIRGQVALEQGDYELAADMLNDRNVNDLVNTAHGALLAGDPVGALGLLAQLGVSSEPGADVQPVEVELQPHLIASQAHGQLGDREQALAEAARELEIRREYGSPARLAEALRRYASFVPAREAVELLDESAALAELTPLRPLLARVLASYGVALQRAGQAQQARSVLTRAADLATEMGMQRVLRRVQEAQREAGARPRRARATGPTSLTESQAQVAAYAVEGLTNREIAERLFVTIKTVETHLMAVYRKLGIRTRDELAATWVPPADVGAAAGHGTGP
jgi:DNA-binding CsgD family transcriptional regulator